VKVAAENIQFHELTGLKAEIIEAADPVVCGLKGIIIFETKNMLWFRSENCPETKQIAKKVVKKICIDTQFGACFISGSSLIGRPEDRISRFR
jgi:ribonuclease P protein subunit POP4